MSAIKVQTPNEVSTKIKQPQFVDNKSDDNDSALSSLSDKASSSSSSYRTGSTVSSSTSNSVTVVEAPAVAPAVVSRRLSARLSLSSSNSNTSAKSAAAENQEEQQQPMPTPKRRGRPPKHRQTIAISSLQIPSSESNRHNHVDSSSTSQEPAPPPSTLTRSTRRRTQVLDLSNKKLMDDFFCDDDDDYYEDDDQEEEVQDKPKKRPGRKPAAAKLASASVYLNPTLAAFEYDQQLYCNFCGFAHADKAHMLEHLFIHAFRCQHCTHFAYTKYDLIKHVMHAHRNVKSKQAEPKIKRLLLEASPDHIYHLCNQGDRSRLASSTCKESIENSIVPTSSLKRTLTTTIDDFSPSLKKAKRARLDSATEPASASKAQPPTSSTKAQFSLSSKLQASVHDTNNQLLDFDTEEIGDGSKIFICNKCKKVEVDFDQLKQHECIKKTSAKQMTAEQQQQTTLEASSASKESDLVVNSQPHLPPKVADLHNDSVLLNDDGTIYVDE